MLSSGCFFCSPSGYAHTHGASAIRVNCCRMRKCAWFRATRPQLSLQTFDSLDGIATISQPVTEGTYVNAVVNLSLGPIQFITTTTPVVQR